MRRPAPIIETPDFTCGVSEGSQEHLSYANGNAFRYTEGQEAYQEGYKVLEGQGLNGHTTVMSYLTTNGVGQQSPAPYLDMDR